MANSLLFFNKDGYPHNFHYNNDTESWEGKILFDENSDQTFKTQSLHIFENVDPIEFDIDVDLIEIKYNNSSGLTIAGETSYQNEIITNIIKVNDSNEFYSKWIYGNDFHKKFPIGTIVNFSGVTGSTYISDFSDDQYFTVLAIKKHAFLIITNTSNDIFNLNFLSGYTNSLNVISINDYNRNLSGQTFFQNLYTDKKLSIINSTLNDSIISVKKSGITYSYLNELKLNGTENQNFELDIQFFTERPKIFQGDVILTSLLSSITGILKVGTKYSKLLAPTIIYTSSGMDYNKKEIIFEDSIGNKLYNGYTFTVDSLLDTVLLGSKTVSFIQYSKESNVFQYNSRLSNMTYWNTIQFDNYLDIKVGDIIELSGTTTSGTTFLNNRDFSVSNVIFQNNKTIIFTPGHINNENLSTYKIYKKLQSHQIDSVFVTASSIITSYENILISDSYCYSTSPILSFQQTYLGATTGSSYKSEASNTIDAFTNKYKSSLKNYGIDVYHSIKNGDDYLSIESLYGSKTKYFYASGYTNGVKINDDFSLSNNGLTKKYDIVTNEKLYDETTNLISTNLYNEQVASEILFNLKNDTNRFGFKLTINSIEYSINFDTDTQTTINNFIDYFGDIFYSNGMTINSGYTGNTLRIETDIDIWDLEVVVNIISTYTIIEHQRNNAILLSGNEIQSLSQNLFNFNLATGMIIKISGSSYNENNKEYNIIHLTEYTISISYQGVFIPESNVRINGKTRDFLRKPRGEYYRDIYLRAYWEEPLEHDIDETIFFYDISGDQLKPYNNNSRLKYVGQKPLIDPQQNNIVILNTESNKDLSKVYDPKYQQTIFDELTFKLEQLDSSISYNWIPEPLEIFIAYNSPIEGVNSRILKIEKIEKFENSNIIFSYSGYTNSGSSLAVPNFIFDGTTLEYKSLVDFNFISYGFKKDQLIKLYFKDQSKTNQRIFENNYTYKIADLSRNKIIIDTGFTYQDLSTYDTGVTYQSTGFTYFTTTGTTFYFNIEVQPKEILSCPMYGQTEIEDIRYKVNLNNIGVQSEDDIYQILYLSDIQDNAIDYTLFNRKRKEMLTTFREIYDYIGSYKSLINAINYFGYNDLQLYEYYKNIDRSSPLYSKLHKVLIPDIFDNSVQGWNELDFIAGKYQQQNTWKKTNLFNLAYRITDEDGNNVLIYSLEDVQYKLTKLKNWLRKNIIPISADLLDITGVSDTNMTQYQDYDESNQTLKSVVDRSSTVVNFNYTATLNFGSDYLITVNFYILSGATEINNNEVPQSFSAKIRTFYLSGNTNSNSTDILVPVQYFKINKNDLSPFTFTLNKYVDPYIYVETTTYDNSGNGLGYVNNKVFYFDEPRNYWLLTHNFDLTKMKYWQTDNFISNEPKKWVFEDIINDSTVVYSSAETVVKLNTLNNKYIPTITSNGNNN